jgi:hypothetical protein
MQDAFASLVDGQGGGCGVVPWEPDSVLPAQLLSCRPTSPEQTLLLAVLEQALRDLSIVARAELPRDVGRRRHRFRRDTIAWFQSNRTAYVTDFVSICEVFSLDPDAVRRALDRLDWRPRGNPTHGVRVAVPGRATRLALRRLRA